MSAPEAELEDHVIAVLSRDRPQIMLDVIITSDCLIEVKPPVEGGVFLTGAAIEVAGDEEDEEDDEDEEGDSEEEDSEEDSEEDDEDDEDEDEDDDEDDEDDDDSSSVEGGEGIDKEALAEMLAKGEMPEGWMAWDDEELSGSDEDEDFEDEEEEEEEEEPEPVAKKSKKGKGKADDRFGGFGKKEAEPAGKKRKIAEDSSKPIACPECNKKCKSQASLSDHMAAKHK